VTERTSRESAQLRERAIALRRAGKSVRQIKQLLGPVGNRKLHDALRGEPPPEWTRRPNAKDDLRAEARELRRQGLDYAEIVRRLGVSKSSVSLWVRDLPRPPRTPPGRMRQAHIRRDTPVLERRASRPRGTTYGGHRCGRPKHRRPYRA
jgi:DNA-binding CsgD family transcriptional regulator